MTTHKIDVIEQYVATAHDLFAEETAQAIFVAGRMIADNLGDVADALQKLGTADASTSMGALEVLSREIKEGFANLSESVSLHP